MVFDAIIVGGGIGGSTLARQLAKTGYKILVLERETVFKDRVRGENMMPWGVAAARRLGIVEELVASGATQPPYWITSIGGQQGPPRDFKATTAFIETQLNMYHPQMQEALLEKAIASGATILRGATVTGIEIGADRNSSVTYERDGKSETSDSRLIVGADGRVSQIRTWAGFEVQKDPDFLTIAGTLIQNTDVPEEAVHLFFGNGFASLIAPLGDRRARVYVVYRNIDAARSLSGKEKAREFLRLSQAAGVPEAWYRSIEVIGPLAEFNGADRWVKSPAKPGIALIGDAAASTDPSWGSGLSLTMVDVEHLSNALFSTSDWNQAIGQYAKEHDEYYSALHRILHWMSELLWSVGSEADLRRAKVFGRMEKDPRGFPDSIGHGPFGPNDEQAGRLLLGVGY
jgi:2-polyprenyl-6-methoxyphenol hydroxylase-like FAD-dependent oxidoreductase